MTLTVYQGEALGIIGRNGAGKSTLLKLLSRITAPTEGEIKIRGRVASMLEVGTGFNNEMTGRENIYMNGAILGMTRAEIDAKLPQIIEFSECGDFIEHLSSAIPAACSSSWPSPWPRISTADHGHG